MILCLYSVFVVYKLVSLGNEITAMQLVCYMNIVVLFSSKVLNYCCGHCHDFVAIVDIEENCR